jgi:hypothetical protein
MYSAKWSTSENALLVQPPSLMNIRLSTNLTDIHVSLAFYTSFPLNNSSFLSSNMLIRTTTYNRASDWVYSVKWSGSDNEMRTVLVCLQAWWTFVFQLIHLMSIYLPSHTDRGLCSPLTIFLQISPPTNRVSFRAVTLTVSGPSVLCSFSTSAVNTDALNYTEIVCALRAAWSSAVEKKEKN